MSLFNYLKRKIGGYYSVGIVEASAEEILSSYKPFDIHWISTPDDSTWMADPFIIGVDEQVITLLVEEYEMSVNKGRLSKIQVDRKNYRLLSSDPVLTLDTHLSFPYPVQSDGEIFVCPESNSRGEAALYNFNGNRMEYFNCIIPAPMNDTQLFEIPDYGWFAFSVRTKGLGVTGDTKEVEIYHSACLSGPYTMIQKIEKSKCEDRGAGPVFTLPNGTMIRPAQNCEGDYGRGVIFFEIIFDGKKFTETEIGRIEANENERNGLRLHTFSPYGNLVAVDGFDFRNRTLMGAFHKALNIYYKIKS
ncbi:MAG: hypothetical protein ACI31E_03935 [Muribaculaceae bacterium]